VSAAVREEASGRRLRVVDVTCSLVGKVHAEAGGFAGQGDTVVLVGRAGHDEAVGTLGQPPGGIVSSRHPQDVDRLDIDGPAFSLTQTTLAATKPPRWSRRRVAHRPRSSGAWSRCSTRPRWSSTS